MAGWDVHTHMVPPGVLSASGLSVADGVLTIDGRSTLPLDPIADADALGGFVAGQGLDGALVSVPPTLYRYHLTGDAGVEWARTVNAALAEVTGGRLRPLGTVPLADAAVARDVAAEVLGDGRFGGFSLGSLRSDRGFADPALRPLWRILDERAAFVLIHPGHCPDPRLDAFYLANLLGNPYETALAASQLLFGHVLERHPHITFCLAHGGGFTAAAAGRWQRGIDTGRPDLPRLAGPVGALLRRLFVDDLTHSAEALRLAEQTFGTDHVLVGSDWPFPMGTQRVDPDRAQRTADIVERLTWREGGDE